MGFHSNYLIVCSSSHADVRPAGGCDSSCSKVCSLGGFLCFPGFFMRLFSSDAATIKAGSEAMRIYFFGFIMMVFQFSGQSTFVGLGRSKQAIFFSILRKIIIVVPLTLLLPRMGFGVDGVFIAEPVSNAIGGGLCFLTMMLTVWRELGRKEREKAQ